MSRRRLPTLATCLVLWLPAALLVISLGIIPPPLVRAEEAADDGPEDAADNRALATGISLIVFGNQSNESEADGRLRLTKQVTGIVEEIAEVCQATNVQHEKLRLAALRDLQQIYERFDALRSGSVRDQDMLRHIDPLQSLVMDLNFGLFEQNSLFEKALSKTLNSDQVVAYKQYYAERRTARYRSQIELVVRRWDAGLSLSQEQRRRLVQLLSEHTQIPPRFGLWNTRAALQYTATGNAIAGTLWFGPFDVEPILIQASGIPPAQFATILTEQQCQLLQNQLRESQVIKPLLIRNGILPGEPAVAAER